MGWFDSYVAWDTETSGLGSSARILEIAVVTFERGEVVNEWSRLLCPPDVDWDDENVKKALAVNKLTKEQLVGQPTFQQVLPDLLVELAQSVWVGHNIEFDIRMLQQEAARLKRTVSLPPLVVCTKNLAAYLEPKAASNKLVDVAPRYGITPENAHRAAVDARTCGLVLDKMVKHGKLPEGDVAMDEFTKSAAAAWRGKRTW